MKTTLITITGPSGAGKDTVARMLSQITGIPILISYTTRPMREGEEDGREHHFVSECNVCREEMLAYTQYGGYEYWTTLSQIQGSAIYVIDEEGLRDLCETFPQIELFRVHVTATEYVRRSRGVTQERIERDLQRTAFPIESYHYRLSNNKSEKALRYKVKELANVLLIQQ